MIASTQEFKAWLADSAELLTAVDATTFTDPEVAELVDRLRGVLENKSVDAMVVTGEHEIVVDPTPEDEAGRVGPTMPQEGQR